MKLMIFYGFLELVLESKLRTYVKTDLEESVDQSVANLNVTVRQMLASYWSSHVIFILTSDWSTGIT